MATPRTVDPWFPSLQPNTSAAVRLFCFPFAGAGASMYRDWQSALPGEVEVCAVQWPGRESRLREAAFTRMTPLVSATVTAMQPLLDRPFALFGHSLGALAAFEVAKKLRAQGLPAPKLLIVSGCKAAARHMPPERPTHRLPDDAFREEIARFGGTAPQVLANDELMQVIEPILRADFAVLETYLYEQTNPLQIPMLAVGGLADTLAPLDLLGEWQNETSSHFRLQALPGDHFFIQSARDELLEIIGGELQRVAQPRN